MNNELFPAWNEEQLRLLLELLEADDRAIVQLDGGGRVVAPTAGARRLLDVRPLRPVTQLFSEAAACALLEALRSGADQRIEETIDDEVYTLELRAYGEGGLLYLRPYETQRTADELSERFLRDTENALATVLLSAAYSRMNCGEDKQEALMDAIRQSCRRIQRGIEHIRELRGPARPEELRLRGGDLAEVCRALAARCTQRCPAVELTVRAPAHLDAVFDREKVEVALANLLVNALTAKGVTRVELSLAKRDGRLILTVVDDGPGIPAADTGALLRGGEGPAETAPEALAGARPGTGLPLARRIAAQHGGVLLVEPAGQGTCVRMILSAGLLPDVLPLEEPLVIEGGFDRIDLELSVLP